MGEPWRSPEDHMSEREQTVELEGPLTDERALTLPDELPILPLRDTVLFPNSFMPLAVARESSVRLIDEAIGGGKIIGVFTQRDGSVDEPLLDDLHPSVPRATFTRCSSCPTAACA